MGRMITFFLDSMRRAISLNEAIGGWDTSKGTGAHVRGWLHPRVPRRGSGSAGCALRAGGGPQAIGWLSVWVPEGGRIGPEGADLASARLVARVIFRFLPLPGCASARSAAEGCGAPLGWLHLAWARSTSQTPERSPGSCPSRRSRR